MDEKFIGKIEDEIEKVCKLSNSEYRKRMLEARKNASRGFAEEWMKRHPYEEPKGVEDAEVEKAENEYVAKLREAIDKFIEDMPDELTYHMRGATNFQGTMFNMMSQVINAINEFKDLFFVCNEQKIRAAQKTMIKKMAEEGRKAADNVETMQDK